MTEEKKSEERKLVDVSKKRDEQTLYYIVTPFGSRFVATATYNDAGEIDIFKEAYEVLISPAPTGGVGIMMLAVGDIIETFEEIMIFELPRKSPYYHRYKEETGSVKIVDATKMPR